MREPAEPLIAGSTSMKAKAKRPTVATKTEAVPSLAGNRRLCPDVKIARMTDIGKAIAVPRDAI